jgi:hypothetical protein
MLLGSVSSIGNDAAHFAQAVALVIGGFWAYWKFLRGRTFRNRAELRVTASILVANGDAALRVTASMRNTGLSRLPLLAGEKAVLVDWLPRARWTLSKRSVYWGNAEGLRRVVVFKDHAELEPGELIADELLIPVPSPRADEAPMAYRVRIGVSTRRFPARFTDKRRLWSANTVVPGILTPLVNDDAPSL